MRCTACQKASCRIWDCQRREPEPLLWANARCCCACHRRRASISGEAPVGASAASAGRRSRSELRLREASLEPSRGPCAVGETRRGQRRRGGTRGGARARAMNFRRGHRRTRRRGGFGVARTALSMDTTLVVYLCRSASVRSMAPTHRPARAARARLSDGRRPRISGDEEKCRAQNDETASSAMFES